MSTFTTERRSTGAWLLAVVALAATACGGGKSSDTTLPTSTTPAGPTETVWLCRPGQTPDPCTRSLATTIVPATGARSAADPTIDSSSPFDCFYVYPTVSTQSTDNANLEIQPAERDAAIEQASPFSQVCRVWAPMYRQRTGHSLTKGLGGDPAADAVAYDSLLSAWKDYLANDNSGRPIIFIGHSQGAAMLIRLLTTQVDPNPALRARTVVAILAGGNVAVPTGRVVGATFAHLPLCTATGETGCVIAYSTFPSEPPQGAQFGRPGQGVSLQSGQTATSGVQVACVNPAALSGGTAALSPEFPTVISEPPPPPVDAPWVTYPDLYSATCRSGGGASWLQVDILAAAGRPLVSESLGPDWGYHADDISLALGDLVHDVAAAETGYRPI